MPADLRRASAALVVLVALFMSLAPSALAQTPFKFDPARDLEAFEDRSFSEYSDLYPLAKYERLKGKAIAPEELARLREEWKAEREQSDARVAAVRADPREVRLHTLRIDLRRHAFFRDVQWSEDASYSPFLLMIQIPLGAEADYATRVAQAVGPWLVRMEGLFRTAFAEPLKLKLRDIGVVYPIFILQSEVEYKDYASHVGATVWGEGPVHYLQRWRTVVAAAAPDSAGGIPMRELRPLLRTAMKAVLDGHTSAAASKGIPLWIMQGVSSYLAHRDGALAEGTLEPAIDPEDLSQFIRASLLSDRADLLLHPLEDLAQPLGVDDVFLLVKNRAEILNIAPPGDEDTLHFFDLQSTLWVHYLRDARNGRNRAAFDKYFHSALNGRGGLPELFLSFEGTDMADLCSDFVRFVTQEHQRLLPNEKLEKQPSEDLFANRGTVRPSSTTTSATDPAVAPRSRLANPRRRSMRASPARSSASVRRSACATATSSTCARRTGR